jgi:surface polysaccharide O-acyltransferase-like enzyme
MDTTAKPQHFDWISNLRVVALFSVVILHTASPLLFLFHKSPPQDWWAANVYNALVRFAVPVFVMVTGALLLHKDYDIATFFKKRVSRVVWPFLFWTLVYLAYDWYNGDIDFEESTSVGIMQVLHMLKYGAFYHLWYVYMLIGLYLVMPVLSKFIRNASENEILYFLIIWLVVMMLDQIYLVRIKPPQLELRYFEGYIGYLILGYYLAQKEFSARSLSAKMLLVFVACVALISIATYYCSVYYNAISTIPYEPISPTIVLLSGSLLLAFKYSKHQLGSKLSTVRDFIDKYGYGIYLGHALVLVLLEKFKISYQLCAPILSIPFTAFICFAITLLLVYLISKLPFGKYISG